MDDSELRQLLGGVDPASSLPPLESSSSEALLEQVMADENTEESRSDGLRRRSALTWVTAAAVVLIIAVGATVLIRHGSHDSPVAGPSTVPDPGTPSASTARPTSPATSGTGGTQLTATTSSARCMVPSADLLKQQTLAFEGTVTSLTDGKATLSTDTVYAGSPGDEVTVAAPDESLRALLAAVDFQPGGHYLVAATDGRVAVCGLTGEETPALASLYADAFR